MANMIRQSVRRHRTDFSAIFWAIACCWLVVWGNYALLDLGVTVFYLIPIDLFVVPLLVTGVFYLIATLTRSR